MFKRILLPTSGSPVTERKARTICEIVNDPNTTEVTILYVIKSYPSYAVINTELDHQGIDPSEICIKDAELIVNKAIKIFKENNIKFKTRIEVGEPVETIVKIAEELDTQLMVVGYHGESTLSDYLFKGNITNQLIDKSSCPILVIK